MNFLRSIFDFYLQSSIHVALAITSLAAITVFQYGFVPEPALLLFILCGSIVGYNFVKYAGVSNLHLLKVTRNITVIRLFSVLCAGGMLFFARLLPVDVLVTAGIFGGLTGLYAIPLINNRNLRSLSGAKIYIIALVWMGTSVMVPLEYHNVGLNAKAIYHCIEIFFFVIALTLPFEIRDLKFDELDLSTIPQNIGIRNTKWLGTGLITAAGIFAYFQNYINDSDLPVTLGIFALTAISIWASDKEQGRYYASFWVESIPILWLILLLMF
ncbi:hypothetical protein [Gracilimonas tropica]|uniref:hypothetical protein n=1 Tax=Gracilimonas tropica TaxID=454600 RepID=UPI0003651F38|nr:hypothetical protein [Gracilimonas tropica]